MCNVIMERKPSFGSMIDTSDIESNATSSPTPLRGLSVLMRGCAPGTEEIDSPVIPLMRKLNNVVNQSDSYSSPLVQGRYQQVGPDKCNNSQPDSDAQSEVMIPMVNLLNTESSIQPQDLNNIVADCDSMLLDDSCVHTAADKSSLKDTNLVLTSRNQPVNRNESLQTDLISSQISLFSRDSQYNVVAELAEIASNDDSNSSDNNLHQDCSFNKLKTDNLKQKPKDNCSGKNSEQNTGTLNKLTLSPAFSSASEASNWQASLVSHCFKLLEENKSDENDDLDDIDKLSLQFNSLADEKASREVVERLLDKTLDISKNYFQHNQSNSDTHINGQTEHNHNFLNQSQEGICQEKNDIYMAEKLSEDSNLTVDPTTCRTPHAPSYNGFTLERLSATYATGDISAQPLTLNNRCDENSMDVEEINEEEPQVGRKTIAEELLALISKESFAELTSDDDDDTGSEISNLQGSEASHKTSSASKTEGKSKVSTTIAIPPRTRILAETDGGKNIYEYIPRTLTCKKQQRSKVWDHFGFYKAGENYDRRFSVCIHCQEKVSYCVIQKSTGNMRSHLERKHPLIWGCGKKSTSSGKTDCTSSSSESQLSNDVGSQLTNSRGTRGGSRNQMWETENSQEPKKRGRKRKVRDDETDHTLTDKTGHTLKDKTSHTLKDETGHTLQHITSYTLQDKSDHILEDKTGHTLKDKTGHTLKVPEEMQLMVMKPLHDIMKHRSFSDISDSGSSKSSLRKSILLSPEHGIMKERSLSDISDGGSSKNNLRKSIVSSQEHINKTEKNVKEAAEMRLMVMKPLHDIIKHGSLSDISTSSTDSSSPVSPVKISKDTKKYIEQIKSSQKSGSSSSSSRNSPLKEIIKVKR